MLYLHNRYRILFLVRTVQLILNFLVLIVKTNNVYSTIQFHGKYLVLHATFDR